MVMVAMDNNFWKWMERGQGAVGALAALATLYYTAGVYYGWNQPSSERKDYVPAGHSMMPPGWVIALGILAILMLLTSWGMMAMRLREGKKRETGIPRAAPPAHSLKDTQFLFHSVIEAAHEAIMTVINAMMQALRCHPNKSVQNLISAAQQGATDLAQSTYGRLDRAVNGFDQLDEQELQRSVGWFWNQYRLQIHFILLNISGAKEAGFDVLNAPLFGQWLEVDRRLRDELKSYCGPQNRDTIRSAMKSNGWDEQIIGRLRSLQSTRS
jgi:hypothetical protein